MQKVWLRAEADNPSCAAARVKLRSCATARKATRVLRFRRDITELSSTVHANLAP